MKSLKVGLSMLMLLSVTATANAQHERIFQNPQRCNTDVGNLSPNAPFLGDYTTIRTNMDVNGDGMISANEQVVACDETFAEAFTEDSDNGDEAS